MQSRESLKQIVERQLDKHGLNAFEAAREAGLERSFIRDILNSRKRSVHGENLPKLARAIRLGTEELVARLSGGEGAAALGAPNGTGGDASPAPPQLVPALGEPDIPVLGTVGAAAKADAFELTGEVDRVRRPPALAGARDVYAIFVARSSMEPEHRPGELRFVSPHRPVRPGDSVVVQCRAYEAGPVEAYLGHFVKETEEKVKIKKLNPSAKIEFDRKFVVAVHKVLTMNELFGV